jgi:DNA-binding transcriptional LysR family regulator
VDLDLACVASYLVVLEEGSYRRAAARLHLSAAAVTKRVQRLEHQVGTPLLVRDHTGVAGPTAAGAGFAAEAPALLAAAEAARAAARPACTRLVVRLGVLGQIGELPRRAQLTELAQRFRKIHPDVRLVCRAVPFPAVHTCLLERAVDVLWGSTAAAPRSVSTTPLVELERVAVVPLTHALADAPEVTIANLAELPVLYNPAVPTSWMTPFILGDLRPLREARLVAIDALDAASVFAASKQESGIIISTSWYTALLHQAQRAVPVVDVDPIAFYAATRRTDRRTPVLSLLELLPQVAASHA